MPQRVAPAGEALGDNPQMSADKTLNKAASIVFRKMSFVS